MSVKFNPSTEAYTAWLQIQAEAGIVWDGILTKPFDE